MEAKCSGLKFSEKRNNNKITNSIFMKTHATFFSKAFLSFVLLMITLTYFGAGLNAQTISTFPHLENFSTFTTATGTAITTSNGNGWASSTTATPKWEREGATTGSDQSSSGTGAFWDHTSYGVTGGRYVFLECSGGALGSTSYLESPTLNFGTNATMNLKFWYHMFGIDMGTLEVEQYISGAWITTGWSKTGSQHFSGTEAWSQATITLSGSVTKIRFKGVRGNGWSSDMCVDDVLFEEPPACPQPTIQTTTGITNASANLGWTPGGTETSWNIEWGATGFTQGNGTTITGISSNPYTLTGLSDASTYDWYVKADCGVLGPSFWEGPNTFTTMCNAVTTYPWTENFTSWPPNCFDLTGGTVNWAQYATTYSAIANFWNWTAPNDAEMITQSFDFTSITTPTLKFKWSSAYSGSWTGDTLDVLVSSNGGTTWTSVWKK